MIFRSRVDRPDERVRRQVHKMAKESGNWESACLSTRANWKSAREDALYDQERD
jgi:hypothetical protein